MQEVKPTYTSLIPVRDAVVFPKTSVTLNIGRSGSVEALQWASENDLWIVCVTQKDGGAADQPTAEDLHQIGTLCRIKKMSGNSRFGFQAIVEGIQKVAIQDIEAKNGALFGNLSLIDDHFTEDTLQVEGLAGSVKNLAQSILELIPADTRRAEKTLERVEDPEHLINLCLEQIDLDNDEKQSLLEETSLNTRAERLLELMSDHLAKLQVQADIQKKLSERIQKTQRESILREQMRTIQEELDSDGDSTDDTYDEKIKAAEMPEDVEKIALKEAGRLSSMSESSPESGMIRNYLDLMVEMPWRNEESKEVDLSRAREILEAEHYGLSKVKKRLLQHLAVMKLKKNKTGTILLFVGPPGVGKTSLGASIAEALGRKFVRVSLGGVRDESEIRGHRRTYIGSMPGRIVQGLRRTGVNNPVFLLDEIDKLGQSFHGDPTAALLEVLDPEQNHTFTDHYLDVPYDLSNVVFIATANNLDTIPPALRDRLEIIRLSGYTIDEKHHIATRHLVSKQLTEHGVDPKEATVEKATLDRLISSYTREAGVRELQRHLAAISRWVAEKVVTREDKKTITVTPKDLEEILGRERFFQELAESQNPPGVVTGLAWTPTGGDILFIESRAMPGSGKMTLTGQLGDVMRESAQIALSLVRSSLPLLVPGLDYDKTDLHVHVPQGAIPKDGPSAGVSMLSSLASLLTGIRLDPKLAMTGEITLRGQVMPVGGIKEKVIAAHRSGVTQVILPKRNEKDLADVPAEIRDDLRIHLVETIEDVLNIGLGLDTGWLHPPVVNAPSLPSSTSAC